MLDHTSGPDRTKSPESCLVFLHMLCVSRALLTEETFAFFFVGSEILPIQLQEPEKGAGISL